MAKIIPVNNDLYYVPNPVKLFDDCDRQVMAILAKNFHVFAVRPWSSSASQEPGADWTALMVNKSNHEIVGAANPSSDFAAASAHVGQFEEARRWLHNSGRYAKGYQDRVAKYLTRFFAESCYDYKTMKIGVHDDPSPQEILVQCIDFDVQERQLPYTVYAAKVKTESGLRLVAAAGKERKFYPAAIVDRRLVLKKPSTTGHEFTLIEPSVAVVQSWLLIGLPLNVLIKV